MKNLLEKFKLLLLKFKGKKTLSIKISSKEKINLLEQLSNLLESGIPLINSLKIIMYQTKTKNKNNKLLLNSVIAELNSGNSLNECFQKFPNIFNTFDLSIIEMGEVTGKLGDSIETIKLKEEKSRELKNKIIGALIYPMVIISLSIIMIGIFMVFVIPKIEQMYKDSKVNLPSLTQNVIDISDFLQENIIILILIIIFLIFGIINFKNNIKTKIYWDHMIIKLPLFGPLIKKKILALFTSGLGILLKNGIIINKSLEISSKSLENKYYEKELQEITSRVSKGIELSVLMGINEIQSSKENLLFPIELASVVKIGEETGNLSNLLIKYSIKANKEIDEIVKNIQTAIEPLVIIGVGLIVGTIIMAIMLPFFNMVNVI
ncbi:MAG: type II secretion system F family protein [Candidatus Gracilibacteria bacterium]|nr:type II secretion system F family protein [Candidatus Gracilibacteria bacterium]